MNGLPADIDLSFLCGQSLIQVCVGAHDLQLNFDEGARVAIESVAAFVTPEGRVQQCSEVQSAVPFAIELLNKIVVSASGSVDGTLRVQFKDGPILEVYDSNVGYESYVITYGGRTIVV